MDKLHNTVNHKELKNFVFMGLNWPKVSTIEPRGTIGDIRYDTDVLKEHVLKIKKSEKNPDPWEISFHMH